MLGAFLRNVASVPPTVQHQYVVNAVAQTATVTSGVIVGGPMPVDPPVPGGPGTGESFYYDYFLGLWVDVTTTPGKVTYSLYVDQAKTTSAGQIQTIQPTDYNTFPQTYSSSYTFTAGALAGSQGSAQNVTNADYSGTATYSDTYADGSKDSGSSSWSGQGDYSWQSRSDLSDGSWTQSTGSWRADGSGGTKTSSSDGYSAVYVYNSDGSGNAHISGPDPGLPATIVWDAYGNTTITYADGTVEHIPGWNSGGGVAVPMATPPVPPTPTNTPG
jgi:hypothetical protein